MSPVQRHVGQVRVQLHGGVGLRGVPVLHVVVALPVAGLHRRRAGRGHQEGGGEHRDEPEYLDGGRDQNLLSLQGAGG